MKIWKQQNKRTKRDEWRARFRLNKKTFRPVATTKDKLTELIAEIRLQEKLETDNAKFNLKRETISFVPTVAAAFAEVLPTVPKDHQRTLSERVFGVFESLLPPLIKVTELKKYHFQLFVNHRSGQLGKQTKTPVTKQTIYKELYAITSALRQTSKNYESLENWQIPQLPELPKGFKKKIRRERLVADGELQSVIDELMKPPEGKQTHAHHFHRVRLAHQIEFGYWTGLRRKEIARIKFSQYDPQQRALLNVRRWKTDTITKFFPLSIRAVEIIEARRELQKETDYIFTPLGEPIESNYRTLREICKDIDVPYGRFTDGGFVMHDTRHNFGTDILRGSDIETARELLGHGDIKQTGTYVHTSPERLREAVRKRDNTDFKAELKSVFEAVKKGELNLSEFIENVKKIFGV